MNMKYVGVFVLGIITTLFSIFIFDYFRFFAITPLGKGTPQISRPLEKYQLLSLSTRPSSASAILLDKELSSNDTFTSYQFSFTTEGKKVTGLIHIPKKPVILSERSESMDLQQQTKFPVIIQFRGYVDREIYETGIGTQRSGEVYAKNGYITIAPDFLGYGGSDMPSTVVLEERFQTYTTALDLLSSISTLKQADPERIGIWGHSNGGHIALTLLAITNKPMPTTLWAPVTKPFPYSILYFTDELSDGGKFLRGELSRFEGLYDVDKYTFRSYLDRLSGPIQLHQGTADDAVPFAWSDQFAEEFKEKKDFTYYRYPGADHNMSGSWSTVVERDIEFFNKQLK